MPDVLRRQPHLHCIGWLARALHRRAARACCPQRIRSRPRPPFLPFVLRPGCQPHSPTSSRLPRVAPRPADIERQEIKVKQSIKAAAKRGDTSNAKTLAKEIVRSRKAVNRMHTHKAQMNSVVMQMENQLAQRKVSTAGTPRRRADAGPRASPGCFEPASPGGAEGHSISLAPTRRVPPAQVTGHMQKSTEVMKGMNKLVKIGDIAGTMQEMQKEMCKAGVIEEMVDDAFSAMDGEDDEDAADEEVEKVMTELAAGVTGGLSHAPTKQAAPAAAAAEEDDEEDMSAMRARLEQLKSSG